MDRNSKRNQPKVVTKRGKRIERVVAVDDLRPSSVFGCLAREYQIVGDIEAPVLPATAWESSQ